VRNRRGLNRIGILAMALLIALGAMGTAYGAWVDEIYIEGTLSTSDINTSMTCSASSPVGCSVSGMVLTITVTDPPSGTYSCSFTVNNTAGSLPIKISSLDIPETYLNVSTDIEDVAPGTQIHPGASATGTVNIIVSTEYYDTNNLNLTFTLPVGVKRWNQ